MATNLTIINFVAYHNRDALGPYDKTPIGQENTFFTAKLFREETLIGQRIWTIQGGGDPKKYSLMDCGIITRVTRWRRPVEYRKPGHQYGLRVHFKVDGASKAIPVTHFPWFKMLLRQQQSFRNGFNRISDPKVIRSLERISQVAPNDGVNESDDVTIDIETIARTVKNKTTKTALIEARLGQGQFRTDVGRRWGDLCAITHCGINALLRASHIKPWKKSNNRDRLNPENGILLAAHLDALFDKGLISFTDSGNMILSKKIGIKDRKRFRLPAKLRRQLTKGEKLFLSFHRQHVFTGQ
jgi:HNH endonuclease